MRNEINNHLLLCGTHVAILIFTASRERVLFYAYFADEKTKAETQGVARLRSHSSKLCKALSLKATNFYCLPQLLRVRNQEHLRWVALAQGLSWGV